MNKKAEFDKFLSQWNKILSPWHEELSQRLNNLDLSALYSCIPDCFEIMYEIYYKIIPSILRTSLQDYGKLHDQLFDIGGAGGTLSHIKSHIEDAERGFLELINLLGEKAEREERQVAKKDRKRRRGPSS